MIALPRPLRGPKLPPLTDGPKQLNDKRILIPYYLKINRRSRSSLGYSGWLGLEIGIIRV